MRLYAIAERKELRSQVRWLPSLEQAKIKLSSVISSSQMDQTLVDLLARIAFVETQPIVRTKDEFDARRTNRAERIAKATQEVAIWLESFSVAHFELRKVLESMRSLDLDAKADIDNQMKWLVTDGFLSFTPWQWLKHYPRYIKAICHRIDKMRSGGPAKDQQSREVIAELCQRWFDAMDEPDRNPCAQANSEFRWMMEELRVSLFAQTLGTSVKVSPQRCEKLLSKK